MHDVGTLRISNPETLKRWIDNGKYQEQLNNGYTFAVHCGRFRVGECTCSACRNKRPSRKELIEILKSK